MKLLLDTHVLLWWLSDDAKLGARVRDAMDDPTTDVFVSSVSFWEIAIKVGNGKMPPPGNGMDSLSNDIAVSGFVELPVTFDHAIYTASLPAIHKDPFDRMLVAQAILEGLTLGSRDPIVQRYDIETIF